MIYTISRFPAPDDSHPYQMIHPSRQMIHTPLDDILPRQNIHTLPDDNSMLQMIFSPARIYTPIQMIPSPS
jgi:hypothetical protein